MSAPKVDVLALLDAYIAHGIPQERPDLQRARAAVAELIEASAYYFVGWAQDEAADDGEEWTGCSEEQHKAAKRLKDALDCIGGAE